ncbi:MAG: Murein hydrolase activator NlpD [Holosporales bacterium]
MKKDKKFESYFLKIASVAFAFTLAGCSSSHEEKAELVLARKISPYYTVEDGDTVQSISDKYGMQVEEFVRTNELSVPYTVYTGQKVIVYQKGKEAQPHPASVVKTFESDGVSVSQSRAEEPSQKKESTADLKENPKAETDQNSEQKTDSSEESDVTEEVPSHDMKWPVKGKVIKKFGDKKNGKISKGISIAAPEGTPVYAAQSGKVFKSNVDLDDFGKTVILQHDDGKMSVYSHLKVCLVKPGQVVDPKTVIGRVGKTGGLKKPELHFQVRNASKNPVDPLKLLK